MRLLVTGGCGFIGSNFIRHILGRYPGYRIVNLDTLTYAGNPENLKDIQGDARYTFVKGKIEDAALVSDLVRVLTASFILPQKATWTGPLLMPSRF